MAERKQALSTTVDRQTLKLLTAIAATDAGMNRSQAFRLCVHEAAVKRGLVAPAQTARERAA